MQDNLWLPIIHPNLCIGCGKCIEMCPTDAIDWLQGKASLVYPERCNYCGVCEEVCPTHAIELPFVICRPNQDGESS